MPLLRLYACEDCGQARSTLDSDLVPLCGLCRGPMTWKQTRDYVRAAHVPKFGQAPALDYNQTRERIAPIGEHGVQVNSLHDIRRIERESEKMARDGVGEQLVFRKYAQDHSNLYTHTLGENPPQGPSDSWLAKNRHRLPPVATPAEEAESYDMGPGAREELASYFPE